MSNSNINKRSNCWCFIIYPDDSAPNNYLSIINNWHLSALISPIHDRDINADETEKKKHIHIMLYFGEGANKSYNQVLELSKQLNGTIPIIPISPKAMIRYFIHADNPEKYQYSKNELIALGGFDYEVAFTGLKEEDAIYNSIESLIKDNCIYNIANLVDLLKSLGLKYELQFLRKHTIYFNSLLNGRYQLIRNSIDLDKKN